MWEAPHEVNRETTPIRPIQRALLVFGYRRPRTVAYALDAEHREFVRVTPFADQTVWNLLALSPDGSRILLLADHNGTRLNLGTYTLTTGELAWLDNDGNGPYWKAAISPTDRAVVTLSASLDPHRPNEADAGLVSIGTFDAVTGHWRQRWTRPGGIANEGAISWSPDGRLIAATYFDESNWQSTVIIDTNGTVVAHAQHTYIPQATNAAWLSEQTLLCCTQNFDLHAWNVLTGARRHLGRSASGIPLAILEDRLVMSGATTPDGRTQIVTTDLHGANPQTFITVHPRGSIAAFDTARQQS